MLTRGRATAIALLVFPALLFVTLLPQPTEEFIELDVSPCLICGERALADALANVLLFVPAGVVLGALVGASRTAPASFLVSLSIEVAQLWVPGRHTSLSDLVFNTAGGALGAGLLVALPLLLRPGPRAARLLVLAWTMLAALTLAVGTSLLRPVGTDATYYGQWTPRLGSFSAYAGDVLEARLGPLPIPAWRVASSDSVRALIDSGSSLEVIARAGRPVHGIAPVFAIADARERQILMIAADGSDLIYRFRTRAYALGLDSPDLRVHGALEGIEPGAPLAVRVTPASGRGPVRIEVNGRATERRLGVADTWALVLWPNFVARIPVLHTLLSGLWLLGLAAPALWWSWRAAHSTGSIGAATPPAPRS